MRTTLTMFAATVLVFPLLASASDGLGSCDAVWDPEVQLTDSAYDHYTDWSGQKNVAVGPDGRIHVVWTVEDYFLPVLFQVFYKRYNPGTGWTADTCISGGLMARGKYSRWPSAAIDPSGALNVVWTTGDSANARNCLYYQKCVPTGNGNGGWRDTALPVTSYSQSESKATPDIACSPDGHVHVVWARNAGDASYGIHYRESTDGGASWQSEVVVYDTAASTANQVTPTVAAAANNTVHVAWCGHPYVGEAYHLYYKKRVGTTWFAREGVVMSSAHQYVPSIACDPLNNNPHIVWRRWFSPSSNQVVHTYWENTWQPVVVISAPPADTTQDKPQLAFTPNGRAHAVWRGWSGASPSVLQVRHADRSPSGTWSAPIDLTSAGVRARDYPSIAAAGHDLHVIWQDDRGTYQNLYWRHGYLPFPDVACVKLMAPSGSMDSGTSVTPACSVFNYDTTAASYTVRMRIGSSYNQTVGVSTHAGGTSRFVTFPSWTAGPRGSIAVSCSTELSGDGFAANNRQSGEVTVVVHDVGCSRIVAPAGIIDTAAVLTPACSVYNYGSEPEAYTIRMRIGSTYDTTTGVSGHAPGTALYVTFPDFAANLPRGSYPVSCSTELSSDMVPSNDKRTGSVTVAFHDVGATLIIAPVDTVDSGTVVVPWATAHNWGNVVETFGISFSVADGYSQTISRTVAAGADSTFQFPTWTANARGSWQTKCSTQLSNDINRSNDRAVGSVSVAVHDVGTTAVVAPSGAVDSGAVVEPRATVRNYGTAAESFAISFTISDGYSQTISRTVAAGADSTFSFPAWTANTRGAWATKCSTRLANDMRRSNDRATGTVSVAVRDVGATAILAPRDTVDSGTVVVPIAVVRNHGTASESFTVWFHIGAGYSRSQSVNLGPGIIDTISFAGWVSGPVGTLVTKCTTALAGDMRPSNDRCLDSVTVTPYTGIEETVSLPVAFMLEVAGANPFLSRTGLGYALPRDSRVVLVIYDATGSAVRDLSAPVVRRGTYRVNWDGRDDQGRALPGGIYYCRFSASEFRAMKKLVKLD